MPYHMHIHNGLPVIPGAHTLPYAKPYPHNNSWQTMYSKLAMFSAAQIPRAVSHFECCSEIPGEKNPLFKVLHDFLSKWERECCWTESITLFFPKDVLFFILQFPLFFSPSHEYRDSAQEKYALTDQCWACTWILCEFGVSTHILVRRIISQLQTYSPGNPVHHYQNHTEKTITRTVRNSYSSRFSRFSRN